MGGIIDDAATMIITGGPLQDGIHGFNDFSNLQYGQGFVDMYSAYDGLKTIKEDVSNIIGNN